VNATDKLVPADNLSGETLLRVVQILQGMVETASQANDVHLIKSKLADCLSSILEEVERRYGSSYPILDPVTGLPDRAAAEEAIVRAYDAEANACVGVLAIDRLATLNLKFGNQVGDEILRHYGDLLRQQLPADYQIFRWSGPALVVLLLRPTRIEQVRREFGRLVDNRYEHVVDTPSRMVNLPILPRWTVWPIMTSPPLLFHKIDSFASMQARGVAPASA
jgi:GGDEF domain-containing protein